MNVRSASRLNFDLLALWSQDAADVSGQGAHQIGSYFPANGGDNRGHSAWVGSHFDVIEFGNDRHHSEFC
jgi:hypothetical protein